MTDRDLLREVFIRNGKREGLSEDLLNSVLDLLIDRQFVPAGERGNVRHQLERLLIESMKGD